MTNIEIRAELGWLRTRFHHLSRGYGEETNTRTAHDLEDQAERERADRLIDTLQEMVP